MTCSVCAHKHSLIWVLQRCGITHYNMTMWHYDITMLQCYNMTPQCTLALIELGIGTMLETIEIQFCINVLSDNADSALIEMSIYNNNVRN